MQPKRTEPAFTLVEVLVAMSIMLIVMGIAWGTYSAATGSVARCRARMTVEQDARAVLGLIERELRCTYLRAVESEAAPPAERAAPTARPAPLTITRQAAPALKPFFRCEARGADGAFLDFTTTCGIVDPDQPGGGIYRVQYMFDKADGLLLRRQDDPLAAVAQSSKRWLCVARRVQEVRVGFFDGQAWKDAWDNATDGGAPCAVRVQLTMEGADGAVYAYAITASVEGPKSPGAPVPAGSRGFALPAPRPFGGPR